MSELGQSRRIVHAMWTFALPSTPEVFRRRSDHWKPLDQPGIRARKGSTSSMKVGVASGEADLACRITYMPKALFV
jgi:hypothetical protein